MIVKGIAAAPWYRRPLCVMGMCHTFRTNSDDHGVWGECSICHARAGYVERTKLRQLIEAEAALSQEPRPCPPGRGGDRSQIEPTSVPGVDRRLHQRRLHNGDRPRADPQRPHVSADQQSERALRVRGAHRTRQAGRRSPSKESEMTDTSPAAVEAVCERLGGWRGAGGSSWNDTMDESLALIRALATRNVRLEEALVLHNCGTPGCLCHECCRAADAALSEKE